MSLIRRLHSQEVARVEAMAEASASPLSALDALDSLAAGGGAEPPSSVPGVPPTRQDPAELEVAAQPQLPSPPIQPASIPAADLAGGTTSNPPGPGQGRDLQGLLSVLKALAPTFRAATVFPGADAAPQRIAEAIGAMAGGSSELVSYLASHADVLELDTAWKRKQLQEFTAALVADRWIATVIGAGGMALGKLPDVSGEAFKPALDVILSLIRNMPVGSVQGAPAGSSGLAIAQASCRISIEIQQFVEVLSTHVPQLKVDPQALTKDVIDFLADQVHTHMSAFDSGSASAQEREELLHCLVAEFSAALLLGWDRARAETLAAIKDAATADEAARLLSQPAYQHGIAFATFKTTSAESIKRLVGTARYAHETLRDKGPRGNQENG